jgi:Leucine-rich repeat (LRR) protein
MCQVCTGKYNENTTALYCNECQQVTSIPSNLVNLRRLHCSDTLVTSIPLTLINLQVLSCSNTKITSIPSTLVNLEQLYCRDTSILFIPNLPNLRRLYCRNTPVTRIPLGIQYSSSDNCKWLVLENITKLIPIQKRFKIKYRLRRSIILLEYFYPDIISLIL